MAVPFFRAAGGFVALTPMPPVPPGSKDLGRSPAVRRRSTVSVPSHGRGRGVSPFLTAVQSPAAERRAGSAARSQNLKPVAACRARLHPDCDLLFSLSVSREYVWRSSPPNHAVF